MTTLQENVHIEQVTLGNEERTFNGYGDGNAWSAAVSELLDSDTKEGRITYLGRSYPQRPFKQIFGMIHEKVIAPNEYSVRRNWTLGKNDIKDLGRKFNMSGSPTEARDKWIPLSTTVIIIGILVTLMLAFPNPNNEMSSGFYIDRLLLLSWIPLLLLPLIWGLKEARKVSVIGKQNDILFNEAIRQTLPLETSLPVLTNIDPFTPGNGLSTRHIETGFIFADIAKGRFLIVECYEPGGRLSITFVPMIEK